MLRYALAPRWWATHLLVAALFVGCLWLGAWQWGVGSDPAADDEGFGGHARNLFYAVEWWFFACVGLWFWGRFLRDQRAAEQRAQEEWDEYQRQVAMSALSEAPVANDSPALNEHQHNPPDSVEE